MTRLDLKQMSKKTPSHQSIIPVCEPQLAGKEKEYVLDCINTGWISSEGGYVDKFERKFAEYIGVKYGIAICNGTAALETALYGLNLKKGSEVIIPSFTIISCALACLRLGLKPVLVDIEPETWNMDTDQIERKITSKTKAIMPVHMYGHPVNMDKVISLAKKHKLYILEDCAQVHGAEYKKKKCGSLGDIASFSFYANKIITTGEGGMVLTDNEKLAQRCRSYRNLCFRPEKRFYHKELGYNFRISNITAAIGLAQLEQIDRFIAGKIELGRYYRERLEKSSDIKLQIEQPWAKSVYWMYCIEILKNTGISAAVMMKELRKYNIITRPFFIGMHQQPVLKKLGLFLKERYPVCERASKQGLYLPSGLNLTKKHINYICDAVIDILNKNKRVRIKK